MFLLLSAILLLTLFLYLVSPALSTGIWKGTGHHPAMCMIYVSGCCSSGYAIMELVGKISGGNANRMKFDLFISSSMQRQVYSRELRSFQNAIFLYCMLFT